MKKDKKVIIDVDIKFVPCPNLNKRHKVETAVIVEGTFSGFFRPGCLCAVEMMKDLWGKKKRTTK